MYAVGLVVEPFSLVNILEVEGIKELNQHGSLKITGMIEQEKEKSYQKMAEREVWVKVDAILENGEKKRFFCGLLTSVYLQKENQLSVLTLEMKSGSYLLDMQVHTRSFQQTGISYQQIIDTCLKACDGDSILSEKEDEKTKKWFMQYQETDWNFLKRLASHMGVPLIPECGLPGKKLYLGYPFYSKQEVASWEHYCIEQDFGEVEKKQALGQSDIWYKDATVYVVLTRELYSLGSRVIFQGRELVVGRIDTRLEGQELYHEYRFITPQRGLIPPYDNMELAGVSQLAKVINVEKTMVQVELREDENRAGCGARWFDYATMYSTPDGTGWYCMPEPGDEVRVVFPDKEEEHAYAASSVHLGAAGGRDKPGEKFFRNKQNKEIVFTANAIILRNNQGLSVELSDEEGIKLISDKDIVVQAEGDIQMSSRGAGIQLAADRQLFLQQGAAKVQVADAITISGGKIYMN